MTWMFIVLAAGIGGLTVEIWLGYKKQVQALQGEREVVQQQIERHLQHLQKIRQDMEATQNRIGTLESEKAELQAEVNITRQQMVAMEERARRQHPTRFLFELDGGED